MKYLKWTIYLSIIGLLSSCIGDDFIDDRIDPVLRIDNTIDSLQVGTDYQFEFTYFNNVGQTSDAEVVWESSDPNIISITSMGLASAIQEGDVELIATVIGTEDQTSQSFMVSAGAATTETVSSTVRNGVIQTTTFYDLEGDFELIQNDGTLTLEIADNYKASSGLPGLYIYLTNNPRSISGAFEIDAVNVFSGAHSYEISGVDLNEYSYLLYFCKPFNVKVGDGKIN